MVKSNYDYMNRLWEMMKGLGWTPLADRHRDIYYVVYSLVAIPSDNISVYKNSFYVRTIKDYQKTL